MDAIYTNPSGGGFNVAEVGLVFQGAVTEYANSFTRVDAMGIGSFPDTAIDGDLQTHTVLGTSGDQNSRLSMTFGFASTISEPSTIGVTCIAFLALAVVRPRVQMRMY